MTDTWRDHAACVGHPLNLWFPERGQTLEAAEAKTICSRCPVQVDCLLHAKNAHICYGIWGGKTMDERQLTRRYRHQQETGCGTQAMWEAGCRCGRCELWADAARDYREKRKTG